MYFWVCDCCPVHALPVEWIEPGNHSCDEVVLCLVLQNALQQQQQQQLQQQQQQQALQQQQQHKTQLTSGQQQQPQTNGMGQPQMQAGMGAPQQMQHQQQMTPAQQAQVAAMYGAMAGQQDANTDMLRAYQVHSEMQIRQMPWFTS